jgi:hypothetical protein
VVRLFDSDDSTNAAHEVISSGNGLKGWAVRGAQRFPGT